MLVTGVLLPEGYSALSTPFPFVMNSSVPVMFSVSITFSFCSSGKTSSIVFPPPNSAPVTSKSVLSVFSEKSQ